MEDGRISWVGPSAEEPSVGAGRRVDTRGAYLFPGLIDSHVHLGLGCACSCKDDGRRSERAEEWQFLGNARAACGAGITAVRDLGSASGGRSVDRLAFQEDVRRYPLIVTAGRALVREEGYGGFLGSPVEPYAAAETRVRDEVAAGARVIKVIVTGSVDFEDGTVEGPYFEVGELRRIVEAARAQGVPVAAHANGPEGVRTAVEAGADTIEHGILAGPENLARMAEAGVYWVPTLTPLYLLQRESAGGRLPEIVRAHAEAVCAGYERGVRVVAGTDAGCPGVPHGSLLLELRLLRGAGLSAEAVRLSATATAAAALGLRGGYGKIEPGAQTDLVWFADDPLDERQAVSAYDSDPDAAGAASSGQRDLEPLGMVRAGVLL